MFFRKSSSDNGIIHELNLKSQEFRAKHFKPVLEFLTKKKVTANMITNARLVLVFIFFYLFSINIGWAAVLSLFILALDSLDGALARFQNKANDRGKFLDVLVDRVVYVVIITTFFSLSASFYSVVYNLLIVNLAYMLASVKKGELLKTDWMIKVYPRLSYVIVWPVISFYLMIFFSIDFLDISLSISNILATILSIYYYIYIQLRWKKLLG